MKINKFKNILILVFILLSFVLPETKVFALVENGITLLDVKDNTVIENNTIKTTDAVDFSFTLKAPSITKEASTPNNNYNTLLRVTCIKDDSNNKYENDKYIYNGSKLEAGKTNNVIPKTVTIDLGKPSASGFSSVGNLGCPLYSKTLVWQLLEIDGTGKIIKTYFTNSASFKLQPSYKGYYYIYIDNNGDYHESTNFKDTALCSADLKKFVTNNPKYKIYKDCTYYDDVPNLAGLKKTDTPTPVVPQIGDVTSKTKYTFLAPLGSIKCMDSSGQDKTCIGNNIGEYLNFIFKFAIGLCAALAVLMLIMAGITYMGDESIFGKTEAKHKMMASIGGLLIALAAWALLNTINPDLTGGNGINIDGVNIKIENLTFFDARNVNGLGFSDDLFLGYMAHQQGAGGIKAIINASQNNTNVSSNLMANMKSNFPTDDAKKTIGTSELTPTNFLQYWAKKLAAVKQSTVAVYGEVDTALSKVAQETGVDKSILVAMCRIESLNHCSSKESITSTNGSYSGLFQLGSDVWNKYKQSTDTNIFDPYANARVAALYFKDNLKIVKL